MIESKLYSRLTWKERRTLRNEYIKDQDGKCCHCGGLLSKSPPPEITNKKINKKLFPVSFFSNPIHLHHSHDTDKTIGAVHAYCNAVLWQYYGE